MSAFALDHIVLVVADVEAALDWYMRHAGLSSVNVDAWREGNAFFPSLRVNEATIIDFVEGEPGRDRGHLDHVCFVVPRTTSPPSPPIPSSRSWTRGRSGPAARDSRCTCSTPTACSSSSAPYPAD